MNLNQDQKNIIFSAIVGDGFVTTRNAVELCHGEKQLDYLRWKLGKIDTSLNRSGTKIIETNKFLAKTNKTYKNYHAGYYGQKYFRGLRNLAYLDKRKNYLNIINEITDKNLLLAIWFGDDGGLNYAKNKYGIVRNAALYLCSYDQSESQNVELVKWFEKNFQIKANVKYKKSINKYYITFSKFESFKILNIIKPILWEISSMRTKFKYLDEHYQNYNLSTSPRPLFKGE